MKCKYCKDLEDDSLCWECPDDPHHGEVADCEECGASYYKEWGGNTLATNEQAKINHPKLKNI